VHPWCKPLVSLTFFERRWPRSKDGEAKNLLLKHGKKSTPAASEVSIQKNIASAKHAVELGHRSNELRLLHLKMILRIDASPNYFPFHAFPGVDKAAFRCERSYWVDLLCFALFFTSFFKTFTTLLLVVPHVLWHRSPFRWHHSPQYVVARLPLLTVRAICADKTCWPVGRNVDVVSRVLEQFIETLLWHHSSLLWRSLSQRIQTKIPPETFSDAHQQDISLSPSRNNTLQQVTGPVQRNWYCQLWLFVN